MTQLFSKAFETYILSQKVIAWRFQNQRNMQSHTTTKAAQEKFKNKN